MENLKHLLVKGGKAPRQGEVPLPPEVPLLTFAEAGSYLRLSAASVRKLVDGRPDTKDDRLGTLLRGWVVRLSPHRRYIRGKVFLSWLKNIAEEEISDAS